MTEGVASHPLISLVQYAQVKAILRHFSSQGRASVLGALRLDEPTWLSLEAYWQAAIEAELADGGSTKVEHFESALDAMRQRLRKETVGWPELRQELGLPEIEPQPTPSTPRRFSDPAVAAVPSPSPQPAPPSTPGRFPETAAAAVPAPSPQADPVPGGTVLGAMAPVDLSKILPFAKSDGKTPSPPPVDRPAAEDDASPMGGTMLGSVAPADFRAILPFVGSNGDEPPPSSQRSTDATDEYVFPFSSRSPLQPAPPAPASSSSTSAAPPDRVPSPRDSSHGTWPSDPVPRSSAPQPAIPSPRPSEPGYPPRASQPGQAPGAGEETGLELAMRRYAALQAELIVHPENAEAIYQRCGLGDKAQRDATVLAWTKRLTRDPAQQRHYEQLMAHYRHWFLKRKNS